MSIKGIEKLGGDGTGYTTGKNGDEHCSNCEHFVTPNGCNGPKMKKLSERPRLPGGNVKVAPQGWCKFWEAEEK